MVSSFGGHIGFLMLLCFKKLLAESGMVGISVGGGSIADYDCIFK